MKNEQIFFFISNNDIYALEAVNVIEIIECQHITHVPLMKDYVKGVTNVRGNIIAVVDLLQRFGMHPEGEVKKTFFVIVKKKYLDKEVQIAMIIDKVFEVDEIAQSDIDIAPDFGTKVDKTYIKKMVKFNDEYIPVLNIDIILDMDIISKLSNKEG